MNFSERLKQLRKEKRLSMDEVGNYVGVGRANIYKYEHGIVVNIPAERLDKLAGLFGVSRSYLMGWTDDRDADPADGVTDAEDRIRTQMEWNVINGLARCTSGSLCEECPYNGKDECVDRLMRDALKLLSGSGAMQPKKYPPSRYSDTSFGCRACGHELAPGRPKFCNECGKPVKWED